MDFTEIGEETKVFPGEYLLHTPSNRIVVCGAFNRGDNLIRAFGNGKYVEDVIHQFKKIELTKVEQKKARKTKRCGKCKGRG
tara:strand:- start:745 stop:990 length:246 start_codon:yes stop_codon:yes gene_type:complete